jgi:threonine dehydrogenase-like Zn-dependent dehydrogenase
MKAVCWQGITDVRVEEVPDPKIINPHDAIVKVTSTAICGSDLHRYDGYIPTMEPGDIVGHEFMGEVVEVGPEVRELRVGDRVVVPFPNRLQMAREKGRAEIINYEEADTIEALREMTGGRGPDACIEAVGMEAHDFGIEGVYDRLKQAARLETGRPHALRTAILACRKGGTVSVAGVFGGFIDKVPFGAAMNKGLTFRMGQTHVHKYLRPLLDRIQRGEIDPSFVVTHRLGIEQAPYAYEIFKHKEDGCVKAVLDPWQ